MVPVDRVTVFAFAFLPLVLALAGLRFLRPRWTLPLIALLACSVLLASLGLLRLAALWLPPASAIAAIVLAYPIWTWRKLALASRYLTTELERSALTTDGLLHREEPEFRTNDAFDRQMHLLSRAVQRERDLRRFFTDRLAQMPDYVLVTDTVGQVVFANAGARRLFADLNGGGALDHADDLLTYLARGSRSGRAPIRFAAAARTHGIPWHCEAETWAGGWFDVRFEPQRDSDDGLVGYVIRIVDKTDATVTQRQRDEALQLLSHDMRAPQSSIITFLDSLPQGVIEAGVGARIRGYAERTLKLADDFVHFAKAQTVELRFEDVDLAAVAAEAVDALAPQARARDVRLALDVPPDELLTTGNPSLIARMLVNLIDNAVKFSPPGGTVRVTCSRGENGATVSVSDQGEGIAPEGLALLYQRFQSSSPAGTHGVGLGLAFVHTVVVRHRGTIRSASASGEGTTFTVELPAVRPGGALPPPREPNTAPS